MSLPSVHPIPSHGYNIVHVCFTGAEQLAGQGVTRSVEMNRSGLSFDLNEGHPECSADHDKCQGEMIFLSAAILCESICVSHQTKGLDRNIGSCL